MSDGRPPAADTSDERPHTADTADSSPLAADTKANEPVPTRRILGPVATTAVWANLVVIVVYRSSFGHLFTNAVVENWATIFVSVVLQALPFLAMGVVVSAAISALVPAQWLARVLPSKPVLAVPVAGLAGAVLPGCECSSVPVAGRLVQRGVPQAAALTFLLAAPAINPVVMVATSVAFPRNPEMVFARFAASFGAAVVVGWLWSRFASPELLEQRLRTLAATSHVHAFTATAVNDFLQAGGFLVLGASLVAALQTLVPASALDSLAGGGVVSLASMAVLAVLLSICSEADAFVAAGLPQFSLTSRLAFLVVGPMIDLKLIALHVGTFGRRFALRFDPLTFVVAVGMAVVVGAVVL